MTREEKARIRRSAPAREMNPEIRASEGGGRREICASEEDGERSAPAKGISGQETIRLN